MKLTQLFDIAADRRASDIHLATGQAPRLRVAGDLVTLEPVELDALLEPMMSPEAAARLDAGLPVERTFVHRELAFLGMAFRTADDGLAATFRILAKAIPPFDRIMEGAEEFFGDLAQNRRKGFVLVAGPTGSGKWTTVCSLVERINETRPARIFVVTAYRGYVFESKQGMITQLYAGREGATLADALKLIQDADPDVIALDDLATQEDLRQALVMADRGHLVVANLHADSAADAIERLVGSAGEETPALRRALADNLVAVTGQRLAPAVGGGRAPIYEWIANSPATREAILSGGNLAAAQTADPASRTAAASVEELTARGRLAS